MKPFYNKIFNDKESLVSKEFDVTWIYPNKGDEMYKEESASELLANELKYREDLKLKAENGCINSLYKLAKSYEYGILINPDSHYKDFIYIEKEEYKAFELYNKIYELNPSYRPSWTCGGIKNDLIRCYERGIGTEIDCLKSLPLYNFEHSDSDGIYSIDIAKVLMKEDFIKANAERINQILKEKYRS